MSFANYVNGAKWLLNIKQKFQVKNYQSIKTGSMQIQMASRCWLRSFLFKYSTFLIPGAELEVAKMSRSFEKVVYEVCFHERDVKHTRFLLRELSQIMQVSSTATLSEVKKNLYNLHWQKQSLGSKLGLILGPESDNIKPSV